MKKTIILAMAACIAATVSAQSQSPKEILQNVNKVRDDGFAQMMKAKDYKGYSKLMDQVHQMVKDALKGVDPSRVDPKDAYDWAQLYDMISEHKTVCDLTHAFLTTNPDPESTYQDKMLMMRSCNAMGEADMLEVTLTSTTPAKAAENVSLAVTGCNYIDTIAGKKGPQEGLAVLNQLQQEVKLPDPKVAAKEQLADAKANPEPTDSKATESKAPKKTDAELLKEYETRAVSSNMRAEYQFASEKAKLLQEEGKRTDAIAALKSFAKSNPNMGTLKHMFDETLTQFVVTGSPEIELKVDRRVGDFSSLSALKGKVVLVDFFAHWCGPCMASVPSMVSMYDDLHAKGLEIVGVTQIYGFFGDDKGISEDKEVSKLEGLLTEKKMTWPVVIGPKDNSNAYGVWGIPETVLIDKTGTVRNIWVGYIPAQEEKIKETVEALLKE